MLRGWMRVFIGSALAVVALSLIGRLKYPHHFPLLVSYKAVAEVATVDTEGAPWNVSVEVKFVGFGPHQGPRPRVRISARSKDLDSSYVFDPDNWWGASRVSVRRIPGGVDVYPEFDFNGSIRSGARFLISENEITFLTSEALGTPACAPNWLKEQTPQFSRLFDAIHAAPGMEAESFDLVALIQAVNALQASGKATAIAALRAYLPARGQKDFRYPRELDRINLIARLLFVARNKTVSAPPMRMGLDSQLPEHVLANHPEFPLVLIDDIPFLLAPAQGRFGNNKGDTEDPHEVLDYCLQYAEIRTEPLTPTKSPLEAAAKLMESDLWAALRSSKMTHVFGSKNLIRTQVLIALGRVVCFTLEDQQSILGYAERAQRTESGWLDKSAALTIIDTTWDATWQDFVVRKYANTLKGTDRGKIR